MRIHFKQVGLLLFLAAALGVIGFASCVVLDLDTLRWLTLYHVKPLLYVLLGLLIWLVWKEREAILGLGTQWFFASDRKWLLGMSALILVYIVTREPYEIKITSDEYVLMEVSQRLHRDNVGGYGTITFYVYGLTEAYGFLPDKRPIAFPFLLSVLHDFTGYRIENAFVLNTVFGFCLVFLTLGFAYGMAQRRGASLWQARLFSLIPTVLLYGMPLFVQNVNGAGFELQNLLFILVVTALGYGFVQQPRLGTWGLLLVGTLFLVYTRYESALFAMPVSALAVYRAAFHGDRWLLKPYLVFVVALYPVLWRHAYHLDDPSAYWQTMTTASESAFSLQFIPENLSYAVLYFFEPSIHDSAGFLLGVLAFPCLLLVGVRLIRTFSLKQVGAWFSLLMGIVVVVNFVILMSYHWGQVEKLEVSRLTLPLLGVATFAMIWSLAHAFIEKRWMRRILIGAICLEWALLILPSQARRVATERNFHAEVDRWALEIIEDRNDPNPYVIASRPFAWRMHNIPSSSPLEINDRLVDFAFQIQLQSHNFYFVQVVYRVPQDRVEYSSASENLILPVRGRVIAEFPFKPYHTVRLVVIDGLHERDLNPEFELTEEEVRLYKEDPEAFWFSRIPDHGLRLYSTPK